MRSRYPELPSHYIHTACQDASTRIKSFLKLKRRNITKTEKPEVNSISIRLDDHLWRLVDKTIIRISTHRGYIYVSLRPHKLYWRYLNSGWKLRMQPKIKLDRKIGEFSYILSLKEKFR